MKIRLLLCLVSTTFVSTLNAQDLEYRDKYIYNNDTVLFEVIELAAGVPLRKEDYIDSDSSQYYDYLIVNKNNRQILHLASSNSAEYSDSHFPNRFASHKVRMSNSQNSFFFGTITENDLTVLADNESYRYYLIQYLIDYGLLTVNGVDRSMLSEFQESHRD